MEDFDFENNCKHLVEFILKIHEKSIKKVSSNVEETDFKDLMLKSIPETGKLDYKSALETLSKILIKPVISSQRAYNFGYFPQGGSYPSLMGNMLTDAIGMLPSTKESRQMADDLQKSLIESITAAIDLPMQLRSGDKSGGVLLNSRDECIFGCVLAVRNHRMFLYKKGSRFANLSQMAMYCSEEAYPFIKPIGLLALVNVRPVATNKRYCIDVNALKATIKSDISMGMMPIFLFTSLGSFTSGSIDNLTEIGPLCKKYNIWLHVDGSYGGISLICPEMRVHAEGLQFANSFNINLDMWSLIHPECACLWVSDMHKMAVFDNDIKANCETGIIHSFRGLKIWMTLACYGMDELREHVRNHIRLAKNIEQLLLQTNMFEVVNDVVYGLVCFRLKIDGNEKTEKLYEALNAYKQISVSSTRLRDKFVIKLWVTRDCDIEKIVDTIKYASEEYFNGICTCVPE